jgi:hypothetical protein
MANKISADRSSPRRREHKAQAAKPELPHAVETLGGKSSLPAKPNIKRKPSPSLPSRERLAQVLR